MSKSVTIGFQVLVYFVPSPIQNNQQAGPFHCKARSGVSHATLWGRVTNFSSFHHKSLRLMKYFQNFEKQLPNWLNLKNPMSISKLEIFSVLLLFSFTEFSPIRNDRNNLLTHSPNLVYFGWPDTSEPRSESPYFKREQLISTLFSVEKLH